MGLDLASGVWNLNLRRTTVSSTVSGCWCPSFASCGTAFSFAAAFFRIWRITFRTTRIQESQILYPVIALLRCSVTPGYSSLFFCLLQYSLIPPTSVAKDGARK